jgi:maltooligosyltrehalose trehalohydrolase
MTAVWALGRGARPLPDGSARFAVWAPRARRVTVRLAGREHRLERGEAGEHAGVVADAPAGADYTYRLDGGPDRPDPVSRFQPHGVHGPSRIVAPEGFAWSDAGWRGLAMADLVLYELHVGTFGPEGTFDGVMARLEYLAELGVTAVELMPVAAFAGTRNWGYDGAHPYAPHAAYGGPDGLRRLVDAAHRRGLGIVLDVVYNHVGPEGNYLAEFGPYVTDRDRTPWGPALNVDGPDSDEVRRYVVDNALYWVTEYHVDGLRLDAVHAIVDRSTRHILAELTEAVHRQAERLGRSALVIAESNRNDPRVVRPVEAGGYGLDGMWSDDFHHAVHARLTGERCGYYADFGRTAHIARCLEARFVLDGRWSAYRRRNHGAPAADVPADRVVVAIQNHDQVGNRPRGDRLDALVDPARRRLAAALLLCSPYVPLLFMGEEYGEDSPFVYFVSHGDPGLIRAVRAGRRGEAAAFGWSGEGPDPQAEESFTRSRLAWDRAGRPGFRERLALYRDLLALRRAEPALRPAAAAVSVTHDEARDLVGVRYDGAGGAAIRVWFNCSAATATVAGASAGPAALLLATDAPRYGGTGATRLDDSGGAWRLYLAPHSAAVLRTEPVPA